MEKERQVCFFTGKRGGFTHFIPIIERIKETPGLSCSMVSCDMHLSDTFGKTVHEVENYVEKSYRLYTMLSADSKVARAKSISLVTMSASELLDRIRPDLVFVLGDRGEVLGMVIAAMELNIPLVHLFGGDLSQGGVDEPVRHAITKMANIHFTSNQQSADRIIKMGEEPWRVHNVGSPVLDLIRQGRFTPKDEVCRKFSLNPEEPVIILLQHSVTWQVEQAERQIRATLEALDRLGHQTVAIYPCSDPGYESIITALSEFSSQPFVRLHKNLEFADFWGLMNLAAALVGNSSAGVMETPSFRIPAVNLGIRQEGRMRAENVLDVDHDPEQIIRAIETALHDRNFRERVKHCSSPYGDGHAAARIVPVLNEVELDETLTRKRMTY